MKIFKKKVNKKFNYQPRYYKNEDGGSPYEIKHKFDTYRKSANPPSGIKGKFFAAFNELREPADRGVRNRLLLIIAILLLIFLYLIDFDLSIFRIP